MLRLTPWNRVLLGKFAVGLSTPDSFCLLWNPVAPNSQETVTSARVATFNPQEGHIICKDSLELVYTYIAGGEWGVGLNELERRYLQTVR